MTTTTRAWWARRLRRATGAGRPAAPADAGNAVVEFLGVALVLLVPTVYLVLVLGQLQASAFAVEGAAREAVRAYVTASTHEQAARQSGADGPFADPPTRALAAVGLALGDQGLLDAGPEGLTLTCTPDCTTAGADLTAVVEVDVALPGVPGWLQDRVPLSVPVSASATGTLEAFGGDGR